MGFFSCLSQAGGFIADLFFIPKCPVCREPSDNSVCPECKKRLDSLFSPLEFFRREMDFDAAVSAFDFENKVVASLVYALKRRGTKAAVYTAGEAIYGAIYKKPGYMSADVITWVPREKSSVSFFGFDQARLIAEYLSSRCGIEARPLVKRTGKAKTQKKLDSAARKKNVLNKFTCPDKVFGGVVILVDDMVTTGATVNEVSRELKAAGYDKVLVLSLASADRRHSAPKDLK